MNEIKHILHAFLLLLAGMIGIICLKAISISSSNDSSTSTGLIDDIKNIPNVPLKGKQLFAANCASCHILGVSSTGPSLCGFESREPWSERENVYQWIRNPQEFMKKNKYAAELKETYSGRIMMAFPNLTNEEIDEIINYINSACNTSIMNVASVVD